MIRCLRCGMPHHGPGRRHPSCQAEFDAENPRLDLDACPSGGVRSTDPATSRVASASNQTARQTQKKQILAHLLVHGFATSHSVAHITGDQHNRASKRLGELKDGGLLYEASTIPAASGGNPLIVYRLTPDGLRDASLMAGAA